jgi:hypothetical protein
MPNPSAFKKRNRLGMSLTCHSLFLSFVVVDDAAITMIYLNP